MATNPAEAAEGEPLGAAMARIVSVPMVPIEHRRAVPVMEPRECKPLGSASSEKWSLRSTDSPMTVRDAVWRSRAR